MPMSIKCIIGKWLHKGQISHEEYDAVIKKLDGHDKHIRNEVIEEAIEKYKEYDCSICKRKDEDSCTDLECTIAFLEHLKENNNDNT